MKFWILLILVLFTVPVFGGDLDCQASKPTTDKPTTEKPSSPSKKSNIFDNLLLDILKSVPPKIYEV